MLHVVKITDSAETISDFLTQLTSGLEDSVCFQEAFQVAQKFMSDIRHARCDCNMRYWVVVVFQLDSAAPGVLGVDIGLKRVVRNPLAFL